MGGQYGGRLWRVGQQGHQKQGSNAHLAIAAAIARSRPESSSTASSKPRRRAFAVAGRGACRGGAASAPEPTGGHTVACARTIEALWCSAHRLTTVFCTQGETTMPDGFAAPRAFALAVYQRCSASKPTNVCRKKRRRANRRTETQTVMHRP